MAMEASEIEQLIKDALPDSTVTITDLRGDCLLYTSPSPRDAIPSRMPSSA